MLTLPGRLGALLALAFAFPVVAHDTPLRDALAVERARAPAPRFDRADFVVRATIDKVTLSPDGDTIAFMRGVDDDRSLWLMSTCDRSERRVLARSDARALYWSRDGRWLFVDSPRHVFALSVGGHGGSRAIVTADAFEQPEFQGVDPVEPSAVIVRERTRDTNGALAGWKLSRVRTAGHVDVLDEDPDRPAGYAFDARGRLAYVQHLRGDAWVTERIGLDGKRAEVLRCERMHRCVLWPLLDREGALLFVGDIGASRTCVQRLAADDAVHDVQCDPNAEVDLGDLAADPATGLPAIATFGGSTLTNAPLDEASRAPVQAIRQRFPERNLTIQPGASHWLVVERDGSLQGDRLHLYAPKSGGIVDILAAAPLSARDAHVARWLPESALARKLPFSWRGADGMRLYGFVWVPPGREASTLPLVAMVHGGPWNNVPAGTYGAGYPQLLANRGYVVFEPNFRGSTGYGRDYMLAADGDFGNGRVQRDIVEGVRALLAQGVGDADRVGIVGASFGGYATLLGVTFQPDLFKVGVAIVPPPDFAWDLAWIARSHEGSVLSTSLPFERWMALVSLDLASHRAMEPLHADAPLAHASRMDRPLLIVAGGDDQRVALRGVLGYAARLKRLDKPVSLLVDPDAGHTNRDPIARDAVAHLIVDMLHLHLGGAADSPIDPALQAYIAANLRLDGSTATRTHAR